MISDMVEVLPVNVALLYDRPHYISLFILIASSHLNLFNFGRPLKYHQHYLTAALDIKKPLTLTLLFKMKIISISLILLY